VRGGAAIAQPEIAGQRRFEQNRRSGIVWREILVLMSRSDQGAIARQHDMNSKTISAICLAISLSACSTMPSSGPTGAGIRNDIEDPENHVPMQIVEVTDTASLPVRPPVQMPQLAELPPPPTDMVGPGDVLSISIFEAGVSLFGNNSARRSSSEDRGIDDTSARSQVLPGTRVDDDGYIVVPYAGKLHVAGKTVGAIQNQIRTALRGLSQDPQVVVAVQNAITNSVMVSGEVARPGRLTLQTNRETLSDVIALAGGYRGAAKDLVLRISRHDQNVKFRLTDMTDNQAMDIRAYPGDRYMLVHNPLSYSVLGASGRVAQIPFSRPAISLAEAVADAGGSHPGYGDPKAIFVFRFVSDGETELKPVVYHINMMNGGSYLLAQQFSMQDKDVLYFGNSESNQPSKVIQLVSQLFSPIATAVSVINLVQDSSN
jgi:polysaccharide export outer membrane protein